MGIFLNEAIFEEVGKNKLSKSFPYFISLSFYILILLAESKNTYYLKKYINCELVKITVQIYPSSFFNHECELVDYFFLHFFH